MAWQDRHYYRDRGDSTGNPLMWLLTGSVPLFTAFGIRVRAHASLVIYILLITVFGPGGLSFGIGPRLIYAAILFTIVLLHEFGHCFAARWVGGNAEDILMHPLGGLAFASPPRRPLPTFITVAGGPFVNVLICGICLAIYHGISGAFSLNALALQPLKMPHLTETMFLVSAYAYFTYFISLQLLFFNLLPIFPLDGGQMLQAILWPKFGYYKSMLFSCTVGVIGGALAVAYSLWVGSLLLGMVAFWGCWYCLQKRRQLIADGPYVQYDEPDYGLKTHAAAARRRRRIGKWAMRRARKRALADQTEQMRIDAILAKVSAHGMNSLSWFERRALRKATEHQRERDLETSRDNPNG